MIKASCICPTFGRCPAWQSLVEEAIESFLRQDYENKELIVFNDCPSQRLICDAEGVIVVNNPVRYSSLGSKYNAAMDLATGDVILPWEDDDISLPWRISQGIERMGDMAYWNPKATWRLDASGWHTDHVQGVCHNASIFRKGPKYRAISGNQDIFMDAEVRARGVKIDDLKHPREWSYIFRYDTDGSPHLSDHAYYFERYYREAGEAEVVPGNYVLIPQWRQEYADKARELAAAV